MRHVEGPTYSRSELRSRRILGVHLGMPFEEARRQFVVRGFTQRPRRDVDTDPESGEFVIMFRTSRFGEFAFLSYADGPECAEAVTAISYDRPLTDEEERQIEVRRREIVAEFGVPSIWSRWNNGGRVNDSMAYVSRARLRDGSLREDIGSCHVNWRCLSDGSTDCRDIMARAQEPMLEISFVLRGVHYQLHDYAREYALLRWRQPDFTDPRYRPRVCQAFPPH